MDKISVVIPVYNTGKYLAECLNSVLAQTFKDIEIICINDGSTDNSQEILESYAQKDSRIKIIKRKNSGVVATRNFGIKSAKYDLVFPLDSDDIIAENTLEKMYRHLQSGDGDIITCRVMMFGNETGELKLPKPTKRNMTIDNCLVSAALLRKSDFMACGGYSNDFKVALEDYDFWLNLIFNHNKKIYRIPEILFYYRIKEKNESRNWQHRPEHKAMVKQMHNKYPQMRKYIYLNTIIKIGNKIRRFLFRIQNNKIKIFKIPVYKINDDK